MATFDIRHLSEALTMIPAASQHMAHGMPLGTMHATASFAYHMAMASGASTAMSKTLLTLDKVFILLMLHELHVWYDYTSAITHEGLVVVACGFVGAFTWWAPIIVDTTVVLHGCLVLSRIHSIARCPKTHVLMMAIGALSYALGIAGVMHCCVCWAVNNYHQWIAELRKKLR